MRATSVASTRAALLNRRLRLAFLADNKWRRAECARNTLPRAVILKRFATDLRVLRLEAAKKLACKNVDLTVIDRTNYHLFQPLLYQVATAALSPADIAAPVRAILSRCRNAEVILAEVQSVNVDAKKVKTVDMEIDYDYLILATGARHSGKTCTGIEESRRRH